MRRCYYGVHAKSEWQWTAWETLSDVPEKDADKTIAWWKDLNDYAASERGVTARKEFRAIQSTGEKQ